MSYTYPYPRPSVTADAVVFALDGDQLEVLLVRRGRPPFAGAWALPGGYLNMDEELESAARRELAEETGLTLSSMNQVGAFGGVDRDPRGRTISVAYWALVTKGKHFPQAGDDAAAVQWFPLDSLPPLAFDHSELIAHAQERAGLCHEDAR